MKKQHWQDWVNLLLGVWIFISPWVTAPNVSGVIVANDSIVGTAVTTLSVASILAFRLWEVRATGLVGIWLMISPWLLGFWSSTAHSWNAVVIGGLLVLHAIWLLTEGDQEKHAPK
jgi:hypothetical protein